MKEKCWKQIQNQLCPPQKWVKDKDQQKCLVCGKQFTIFRRRHHCRFCGNIFCSDCSDYFFNGKYLGQTKQKQVRHCQICHKRIEKFVREWEKVPEIQEEKKELSQGQEQVEDEDVFNLNKIFDENEKNEKNFCELGEKIEVQMRNILQDATDALCDKFTIQKKHWKEKLSQLAIKGALETKMQVLACEGSIENAMDIARQIKIKTVITQPNKAIQVIIKGIVVEKNLPTKNMINKLSNPRVLIIQNSIDIDTLSTFFKFEELVKNEKSIMKKILQKISKLNPDIIFVGQTVSVYALEYFQSQRINVISKMKQKDLQAIKQIVGIKKMIKKIWQIEKYRLQNILGHCDKIYFKNVKEGQVLMFVESDIGIRTLILGQSSEQEVNSIKRSTQILLRLARQITLEKHLMMIDFQHEGNLPKKQNMSLHLDLNKNMYANIEAFLLHQEIAFSKITFNMIKFSQMSKLFQEYGFKTGKINFIDICGKVDFNHKKIYSNGDITLGGYILLTAANFERPCKTCENGHNSQRYYIGNKKISVSVDRKQNNKSSFIEQFNEQQLTLEKLKSFLNKQKQTIAIETYFQCEYCNDIMGKSTKVGKLYLSNSFHYFLYLLSQEPLSNTKRKVQYENMTASKRKISVNNRKLSLDHCNHEFLVRVFEYEGVLINFVVSQIQTVKIDYIDLDNEWAINSIMEKENEFIKNHYCLNVIEKFELLERTILQLQTLPFPMNSNLSSNFSFPENSKMLGIFQNFLHIKEILQKQRIQIKEIQAKGQKQLIKLKHDWTILNRRMLKVQSIIQVSIVIINGLSKLLKKKKFDESIISESMADMSEKQETQNYSYQTDLQELDIPQNLSPTQSMSPTQINDANLGEDIQPHLKKINRKRYPKVQGTYLLYFVPSIGDPVSMLACALNSGELRKFFEDETVVNSNEISFKLSFYRKIKTDSPIKAQVDKIYTQVFGELNEKSQTCEFTIHYAKQFEELRKRENISNQLYVRSLCTCKVWDSSGGKSNSLFAKAENDLLIVKVINEKQFEEFLKFVKDYLEYMKICRITNKDTFIAKVFGIYEVTMRGKVHKCIVMQNIFFGLQGPMKVYDLKGSQVNRLSMPPDNGSGYTGQDTNFKIDKNGEPYILQPNEYDKVIKILEDDSNFLKDHSVIDYSLLVISTKNSLRIGIIDYMRPYHLMEKLETLYKQIKSGRDPTVIPPNSYAERFISAMKKYFIKTS